MPNIVHINKENFRSALIDSSMEAPLVAQFWSPRSQACTELSGILENLADVLGFTLCKIDVDVEPEIAQAMRIQGIPETWIMDQGRPAERIQAHKTAEEWKNILNPYFKNPLETALENALALRIEGHYEQALEICTQVFHADPSQKKALLLASRCLMDLKRLDEARQALESFQNLDEGYTQAQALLKMLSFANELATPEENTDEDRLYRLGLEQAINGNYTDAFEHLLKLVQLNRTWKNDAARLAMIALFATLQPSDPDLVKKYRQRLSMLLFA